MLSSQELVNKLSLERAKIRGNEIICSCPFSEKHFKGKDTHPSFSVNVEKGLFLCFACFEKGTIEELVAKVLKISVPAALEVLQEWGFDKLSRELRKKEVVQERPEILPEGLLLYYDKVDDAFAEIYRGTVGGRECLIYPIRNNGGRLVGALARSVVGKWHRVLWNTPKKLYFYGEEHVEKEKTIVIVEGVGDSVSLRKSGLKNVVALMGALISDEQVERLLSLSSSFVVCLDADVAGARGAQRIYETLDNRAFVKYVDPLTWFLKGEKDIRDVYEQRGPEVVREIIDSAKTFLEYLMEDKLR